MLPELGYSAVAKTSYKDFVGAKAAGQIPSHCRFQVSLPTPLAPIHFYVVPEDQEALELLYEARLLAEVDEILAAVPASQLAIQWDTAAEFGIIEGIFPTYLANPERDIPQRLVRLGNAIPAQVELGYHLCYGDSGHQHFVEPNDTTILVKVANAVARGLDRRLNWVHLPVPPDRRDQAYFLPLTHLDLPDETELYLGLIHMSDGEEGARKRIKAARSVIDGFGVATECGFGRRPPESIPDLMRIHTGVAESLDKVP